MNLPEIQLEAIGPMWLEVVLVLTTLATLSYAIYGTRFHTLRIRMIVSSLRLTLLAIGWLLLHHPTFVRQVTAPQERKLAVLVDRSGSMGADSKEGVSRYEEAFATISDLGEKFDVFELDQALSEPLGALTEPRKLSGNKTDFHTSLSQLFTEHGDYTAVLMLSDGHDLGRLSQMASDETQRWMERMSAPPINTVLVGSRLDGPEIAIHSIDAPGFSFVRAPLRIRSTVLVRNLDKHNTQAQLLEGEKIINIQDLELDDQGFGTVEFEIFPEQLGEHLYTVHVPAHHLETNIENNRQQVLIDIGRDKIRFMAHSASVNSKQLTKRVRKEWWADNG